jgi:hypothetical protein
MQDDIDEEDEMFNLVLSVGPGVDASIAPGSATATITITDEDCKTLIRQARKRILYSSYIYTISSLKTCPCRISWRQNSGINNSHLLS